MLEGGNIKLFGTISDTNGMSEKALMDFILTGEMFDKKAYDRLVEGKTISKRLKASKEDLVRDMQG